MRIIELKNNIIPEKPHKGVCPRCGNIFEFVKSDVRADLGGVALLVTCPNDKCRRAISVGLLGSEDYNKL